jgi:hypothetical protein
MQSVVGNTGRKRIIHDDFDLLFRRTILIDGCNDFAHCRDVDQTQSGLTGVSK